MEEVFEYLDNLRESGEINMFGAVPHIQNEFGIEKKEAREILTEWLKR
tara:strand:- start:155 stop:298 length:144 start_codon:yes stop_codon:yes gene_type:complete